jgi:hypothetical protein
VRGAGARCVNIRRRDHQPQQQHTFEGGNKPVRTDRQPGRQRHVQNYRHQDRELSLPERLDDAQLRVMPPQHAETVPMAPAAYSTRARRCLLHGSTMIAHRRAMGSAGAPSSRDCAWTRFSYRLTLARLRSLTGCPRSQPLCAARASACLPQQGITPRVEDQAAAEIRASWPPGVRLASLHRNHI